MELGGYLLSSKRNDSGTIAWWWRRKERECKYCGIYTLVTEGCRRRGPALCTLIDGLEVIVYIDLLFHIYPIFQMCFLFVVEDNY